MTQMRARYLVAVLMFLAFSACTPQGPLVSTKSPVPASQSPSAGASSSPSPSPSSHPLVNGPGSWRRGPDLLVARSAFTATLLGNGKVLVAGGQTSPSANTAAAELIDPATNTAAAATSMGVARSGHTATLLGSGKVLVAGGIDAPSGKVLASSEIYDPSTNVWSPAASMSEARMNSASVLLKDGRVLVIGGSSTWESVAGPFNAEVYDPGANAWTSYRDDDRPYGVTATLLLDGRVLVNGGWAVVGPRTADFFDPANGGAMTSGQHLLPMNRNWAHAALLPDGGVIFIGGQSNSLPGGALNSTDLFAIGDSWTVGPAMTVGHCHDTATTLASGAILVAGGRCGASDSIAVAELFDPNTRQWVTAASLLQPTGNGSAVLLSDRRVLVAGGQTTGGTVTNLTELYTPA